MSENAKDIVTDEEINKVLEGTSFGMSNRQVVEQAVLKHASGYYQGQVSKMAAVSLGLIAEEGGLTDKGKQFLWASFKVEDSI